MECAPKKTEKSEGCTRKDKKRSEVTSESKRRVLHWTHRVRKTRNDDRPWNKY